MHNKNVKFTLYINAGRDLKPNEKNCDVNTDDGIWLEPNYQI